ncbi:MAG TPA: hypothetical protein VMV48_04240 [Gallionellaceae bacterium]|nr:hypothetical protein [Gallionellaceae bacterium]
MLKKIKRILLVPCIWLLALFFLLEEFIWDVTGRFMARLGAIHAVHALEKRISLLSAYSAMLVFLLPSATLIPAKLIGLHAIATGHVFLGSLVFLTAKLVGMAFFSRIFNLTKPALLKLNWFRRFHDRVMMYRNRIHAYLDSWESYQRIMHRIKSIVKLIKGNGRLFRYFKRAARWKRTDTV